MYGAPGETVCWACPPDAANTKPEAKGPALHTSTGSPVVGEHDLARQLPDTPTLLGEERNVNGNYIVWTIVGVLAIIALLIYIAPHFQ